MPFHVLNGEAIDVARFFDKYMKTVKPNGHEPGRPGLDSVFDPKRGLTAKTAEEIRSLREALHEANTAYVESATPTNPSGAAPVDRARFVVDEITAVLEWHFDDGVEDERDAQLAMLQKAHENTPDSTDALAAECEDYAALAQRYRKEIDGIGGFDAALIDEAKKLAAALRERPATPAAGSKASVNALALRNRVANLLHARMSTVRSAARFVFRGTPDIVREVTSAYQRRRRAAARRAPTKKTATSQDAPQ
ncbi:MAG: hypothetical protein U0441_31015 [Polyangiaceae bacterium]